MLHHLVRTASSVIALGLTITALNAKDIPVMKETTLEISVKDYSVVKFPFKVTNMQLGSFRQKVKVEKETVLGIENNGVQKITLSKNQQAEPARNGGNILNVKKIDNMLTFRPSAIGETEMIIWGNKDFPMIINLKVVEDADKNIEFIQVLDSRKDVLNFEANPHEQVIEKIMRHLYNSEVNKKPGGYENVVRKEVYDVGIKDRDGNTFARVRTSLSKEVVGSRYVGQVWNVNIVAEFDNEANETINIPDGFVLTLYEEMFDNDGVFAVSLETYRISKEHGTRIMVVRKKEEV